MYIELIRERVLCVCLVLRAHCTFEGDGGSKSKAEVVYLVFFLLS